MGAQRLSHLAGPAGRVQCAGRWAAQLGAWQGTATGWDYDLTAEAEYVDRFWLESGGRLALELQLDGGARWRWAEVEAVYDPETDAVELTMTGRPERGQTAVRPAGDSAAGTE